MDFCFIALEFLPHPLKAISLYRFYLGSLTVSQSISHSVSQPVSESSRMASLLKPIQSALRCCVAKTCSQGSQMGHFYLGILVACSELRSLWICESWSFSPICCELLLSEEWASAVCRGLLLSIRGLLLSLVNEFSGSQCFCLSAVGEVLLSLWIGAWVSVQLVATYVNLHYHLVIFLTDFMWDFCVILSFKSAFTRRILIEFA